MALRYFLFLFLLLFSGILFGFMIGVHFSEHTVKVGKVGKVKQPKLIISKKIPLDDEELLWRASAVPTRVSVYKSPRVPKIAFLFLTRGPLPLAPLWARFFKSYDRFFSIFVHATPGYFYSKDSLPKVFHGTQIPSQKVKWGEISVVDAERRLLAHALLDPDNQRFILISESCIPLYNFTFFYSYLIYSEHSFVASKDVPNAHGRGRYSNDFLPEVRISQWRKGSQWFEMTRSLAIWIVADTHYYPKFHDYCRPYCYVDEHYFPTMLYILAGNLLANRSLTWVDWSKRGFHPKSFSDSDVNTELIERMRGKRKCEWNGEKGYPCFLIARKFLPGALSTLLIFAEYMGY